jgi:hypothetical protein
MKIHYAGRELTVLRHFQFALFWPECYYRPDEKDETRDRRVCSPAIYGRSHNRAGCKVTIIRFGSSVDATSFIN